MDVTIQPNDTNSWNQYHDNLDQIPYDSGEKLEFYNLFSKLTYDDPIWVLPWDIMKNGTKVGMIGFKGYPDIEKNVEIGYNILSKYQNQGIASKAVKLILEWAYKNGVRGVIAETLKTNVPSIKVLEKNGFEQIDSNEDYLKWFHSKST